MLLSECKKYAVTLQLKTHIDSVTSSVNKTSIDNSATDSPDPKNSVINSHEFRVNSSQGSYRASSIVVATGGLSVTKMGASDFGLRLAKQFGLNVIATRPGLVPLSFSFKDRNRYAQLSGIAVAAEISYGEQCFKENLLFTHKGISGPVVLQISSYWKVENNQRGESMRIKLMPELDLYQWLLDQQVQQPKVLVKNLLARKMPKRLVECLCQIHCIDKPVNQYNLSELKTISDVFQNWRFWPDGTEGYRVAEVTVGGVDTNELSSKTMQAKKVEGLYFIGEVVDVAGQLGGYNFQWAWSSGFSAGQFV
jgi:predicted Rossmann fold flavoprotein